MRDASLPVELTLGQDPRLDQEARIALMEHYTSQLQGYKIYLLTVFVGLLGALETLHNIGLAQKVYWIWSFVAIGIASGGTLYCLARIFWYGALAGVAPGTEMVATDAKHTLMYQLKTEIGRVARGERALFLDGKGKQEMGWARRHLVSLGDYSRTDRLLMWCFVVFLPFLLLPLLWFAFTCN